MTDEALVKRQGEAIEGAVSGFRVSQWLQGKGGKSQRPSRSEVEAAGYRIIGPEDEERLVVAVMSLLNREWHNRRAIAAKTVRALLRGDET